MVDNRDRRGWHLDKTMSIGHILTTLSIAGGVFVWAMKMDTRVAVVEAALLEQRTTNQKLQSADERIVQLVREDLRDARLEIRELSAKVDRLGERRH